MNPSTSSTQCDGLSAAADDHMDDWLFLSSKSLETLDVEGCTEDQEAELKGKFKSKLVSAWNSVKYGQLNFPDIETLSVEHFSLVYFFK